MEHCLENNSMIIKPLPLEVIGKIKAGEVIEDPSSVLRELLDNAIDAHSSEIDIEIKDSGFTLISLKDNGIGMSQENIKLAYLEHTTSKITHFNDILNLQTHGFRGEALASICKVAKVSICSSDKESSISHNIEIFGGQIINEFESAKWQGTCVSVADLFYNMPVRKQFLKSKTKELGKLKKELLTKALAYPHIRFSLKVDGKISSLYDSTMQKEDRLISVIKIAKPLKHFHYKDPDFEIEAFLTHEYQTFNHSGFLYFFVNNRPLNSKSFFAVMKKALSSIIPSNQYLGGGIYITTAAANIDPNIHPSKKEIKLFNEKMVLSKLYHSLIDVFHQNKAYSVPFLQAPLNDSSLKENQEILSVQEMLEDSFSFLPLNFEPHNDMKPPLIEKTQNDILLFNTAQTSEIRVLEHLKYIGTLFGTYWLFEIHDKLYMIDFHAAHERQRYENLKKHYQNQKIESQGLLNQEIIPLTVKENDHLERAISFLEQIGFQLKFFGENILNVSAIPSFYKNTHDWIDDIHTFLEDDNLEDTSISPTKDYFFKRVACRYSYMSQDTVSQQERDALVEQIFSCQFPPTCPHGRPFLFILSKNYIEAQFLRK
jgi:DNA mismatch repair protein MutL